MNHCESFEALEKIIRFIGALFLMNYHVTPFITKLHPIWLRERFE